ncbi:MAG TPA: hypothetical protein VGR36_11270 [Candidatus Acidoferrales bacterium]|nr:hypothetical protein [Candidatus Acidoferrales bacterium]
MRTVEVCACVLALGTIVVPAMAAPAGAGRPQNRTARAVAKQAPSVAAASRSQTDSEIAAESQSKLPIRRVVLYKTGVGYFEHLGQVGGDQTVGIDFTSGQLNDVLQSLTVLDLGGGRITAVDYNSEAPFSQRLGMLRLPLTDQTNISNFYGALRGARLEVRSGSSVITGRLLSVQQDTRVVDRTSVQVNVLTLVSDSGEVRSIDLAPGVSVRLADHDVNEEVGRYLSLLSSVRQQDLRRMTISTSGSGERQLFVSYISEVPIWKTTYRVVMPTKPGDEPLLQGWAIVDNTVGEDWNNVELSLVAGSPQSFIEQLSQPYYARRPVVPLPQAAQLTPQTHESAMQSGVGGGPPPPPALPMVEGKLEAPAAPRPYGAGVGGGQMGGVLGGIIGSTRSNSESVNVDFAKVMANTAPAARGQELGDLFEYKLKDRVTIHKNESALVPIVQTNVKAEKVSLWNQSDGSPRPLRALWITNSSGLTLDGGSFSVIEDNAFAGEGLTDPIKPDEKRLISYAADLGVRVASRQESDPQRVTEVRITRGIMIQTSEFRQKTTYTINDDDTTPRTVLIEYPVRGGWKLGKDTPKPAEETPSLYRFRVELKPKTEAKLAISESRPIESNYDLTNLTSDQIELFVHQGSINPQIEAAFRKIVAQKAVVAGLDAQLKRRSNEKQQIFQDQQRIRENLKALKGTAEERALTERYTKQLSDQETQLETLRRETADLQTKRDQAQAQLDNMIQNLTLDATI